MLRRADGHGEYIQKWIQRREGHQAKNDHHDDLADALAHWHTNLVHCAPPYQMPLPLRRLATALLPTSRITLITELNSPTAAE